MKWIVWEDPNETRDEVERSVRITGDQAAVGEGGDGSRGRY